MLFNSIDYLFFFFFVFLVYWFLLKRSFKLQNLFLLLTSYFFYSVWNWKFLFLLIFSTTLDFVSGLIIEQQSHNLRKKIILFISVFINLGFLAIFKYYNFFIDSFANLLTLFGFKPNFFYLEIILPVGISFYTFHGLSYVIDIYYKRIKAEKNIITYSLFVSFFPLLVAGPIERATHLLPQLSRERNFDYSQAISGLRQILWGFVKKLLIADLCAVYVNLIFENYTNQSSFVLIIGAILFAFQIYGDFSGYTDIALGSARLLGIELLKNFNFPYFSRDIAEFWRRWHISLSSWFKDYLYIPLGGSKGSDFKRLRNTFVIFLVSGLWHGANWTFIFWGLINAIYFIPLLVFKNNRVNINTVAEGKIFPSWSEFLSIIITFTLTCIAWIFFRSPSLFDSFNYIYKIVIPTGYNYLNLSIFANNQFSSFSFKLPFLLIGFLIIEWLGRNYNFAIEKFPSYFNKPIRWSFYIFLLLSIYFFGDHKENIEFIYFQF